MKRFFFFSWIVLYILPCAGYEVDPAYLLPDDHKAKAALDAIFSRGRVSHSTDTLREAGFVMIAHTSWFSPVVLGHRSLPGYLIKIYPDTVRDNGHLAYYNQSDGWHFAKRVRLAREIDTLLSERKGCGVTIPQKWIYRLPNKHPPPVIPGQRVEAQKRYLLLVEQMPIVGDTLSKEWYKTRLNQRQFEALMTILTTTRYNDVKISNLPWTSEGCIAIIDTGRAGISKERAIEHFRGWVSPYYQQQIDRLVLDMEERTTESTH